MGDLLHMFGVIEGSGGDNDERACMLYESKKKKKEVRPEAVGRPYGGLMEEQSGRMSGVSSPACRRIIKIPGTSHNLLRNITIT